MKTIFVTDWLAGDFTRAFSWTLIHSLWQGLAAAIVAGIIILCTKRSGAGIRYNLLSAVFILFVVTTAFTFFSKFTSYNSSPDILPVAVTVTNTTTNTYETASQATTPFYKNLVDDFDLYFEKNAPLVVMIWFMIFLVQSVKLFRGLYYIQNLRRRNIYDVPAEWKEKLLALCHRLGITQTVLFMESGLVKMPVVLGYLKPTVLVPIGMLAQLPPEQVETILLHELAHIRRKDYLVNLLQSFAEAIFFFNPAIKWLSAIIRDEREACCDDVVVATTSNKTTYLQALVNFNDTSLQKDKYAMALGGRHNSLLNRVKRMLTYENNKLNIMEKLFLVSGLVVFTAFSMVNTKQPELLSTSFVTEPKIVEQRMAAEEIIEKDKFQATEEKVIPEVKELIIAPAIAIVDTVPTTKKTYRHLYTNINNDGTSKSSEVIFKDENGKNYRVKKLNNKVTEFYVDDVRISDSELETYATILEDIDLVMKKNEELSAQRRDEARVRSEQARQKREEMRERNVELQEKRRVETEGRSQQLRVKREEMTRQSAEFTERRVEQQQRENEGRRAKADDIRQRGQEIRERNLVNDRNSDSYRRSVNAQTAKSAASRNEVSSIVNELIKEKLVSDIDNISFTLNNNSLVVNGAKQSADLHMRLKEKFIYKEGDSITYSKSGNTINTSINRN